MQLTIGVWTQLGVFNDVERNYRAAYLGWVKIAHCPSGVLLAKRPLDVLSGKPDKRGRTVEKPCRWVTSPAFFSST